ncbi:FadR/GntR family transcriptional regulator [Paenibacillus koleovorans]|uniref:FadR/GntR family transcriptional regulator n=1 Tax=Paenibacillus koleovorans TaxID=121608 RepID=UPI000FD9B044|nr:FadR/GntR family transcriptional regulator [Paenibacillus koleovorans]
MTFQQVKPQKGNELVMEAIRRQIEEGQLPPGQKIASVVDLAASFGVGRSTIREALSALRAMGYVDIRQGGGTYVVETLPTRDGAGGGLDAGAIFERAESLRELLEVRQILETGCAAAAARHRTEADLLELDAIIARMQAHLSDESIGEEADVQFHLRLAASSHNSLLGELMATVSQRLHDSMRETRRLWFYGERAEAQRLTQEHSDIVEAVRRQDETEAFESMRRHLQKVENVLRQSVAGQQ